MHISITQDIHGVIHFNSGTRRGKEWLTFTLSCKKFMVSLSLIEEQGYEESGEHGDSAEHHQSIGGVTVVITAPVIASVRCTIIDRHAKSNIL